MIRKSNKRIGSGLPSAACILKVIESDFSTLWSRRLKHHARSVSKQQDVKYKQEERHKIEQKEMANKQDKKRTEELKHKP